MVGCCCNGQNALKLGLAAGRLVPNLRVLRSTNSNWVSVPPQAVKAAVVAITDVVTLAGDDLDMLQLLQDLELDGCASPSVATSQSASGNSGYGNVRVWDDGEFAEGIAPLCKLEWWVWRGMPLHVAHVLQTHRPSLNLVTEWRARLPEEADPSCSLATWQLRGFPTTVQNNITMALLR